MKLSFDNAVAISYNIQSLLKYMGGTIETQKNSMHAESSPTGGIVFIDVHSALEKLARGRESFRTMSEDLRKWRGEARGFINPTQHEELHGGYNNLVVKDNQGVLTIFWRQRDRWEEIMHGVLLEDCMSRHFSIPGRLLQNPLEPITITPDGLLVTHFIYIEAESRYPWNADEIASAAKTLGSVHEALRKITYDPRITVPSSKENQLLHRDFGRGNVLFQKGTATGIAGVIDYERSAVGPVEQDLGKTLSFILADTKLPTGKGDRNPTTDDYAQTSSVFFERFSHLLENYPENVDVLEAAIWAELYLKSDDYGDLNLVRDMAMQWLRETILSF